MGSKRGRLLIRQPRIKKDIDGGVTQSADLDTPEATVYSTLLTVPRMERHASEPTPPTHTVSSSPSLLAVPTSSLLIKQHSHPLLPSQSPPSASSYTLQRQLSHPLSSSAYTMSSPPMPLHSSASAGAGPGALKAEPHDELQPPQSHHQPPSTTANPTVVIVPDSGGTAQSNSPPPSSTSSSPSSTSFAPPPHGQTGSNNNTLSTQRFKSEELHRSISSPVVSYNHEWK